MALRGKPPEQHPKRLKALLFGGAGAGKTTCAIQFPKPYLIDTEGGAENDEYTQALKTAGGVVFRTNDWDEVVRETRALLTEKHEFRTLVIDPLTTIYDDALDSAEREVGNAHGKHYGEAKKDWKRLARLLVRLDMNVVIITHAKKQYAEKGPALPDTYDGPKGLDYFFDLVFEVVKRGPRDRAAVVRKTRCPGFADGDTFAWSYLEVAKRYGKDVLDRQAVPVVFATPAQCEELRQLLETRRDAADLEAKWLKAASAETIEELPAEAARKYIAYLCGKK